MNTLALFNLAGKTALVTGCDTGLGQGMALALAKAGADIVGASIVDDYSATKEAIEATGRKFTYHKVDIGDRDALYAFINKVKAENKIDILVNNAGIIRRAPVLEFSEKDWDEVMAINLKAVFLLSQAAGRVMAAQGSGKIINIASMLSFQGGIRVPSYTASKSGVAGLTRLFANELAARGLNINAIAPGYMATDNTAPLRADAERAPAILERIPAGRWGEPADLMGAVVFLASAASDYMNGAIVPVDGGWLTR